MSLSFGCSAKISLVGGDTDQAKKAISKKYPQRFLQLKDKEVAKSRIDLRGGLNLLSGHRTVGHFGHNDTMTQAERSSTDDTDTTNHQPSPRPQTTVISGGGAESFYRTPSIDSRPSIFNGGRTKCQPDKMPTGRNANQRLAFCPDFFLWLAFRPDFFSVVGILSVPIFG